MRINYEWDKKFQQLVRLLDEAYDHYFEFSDGHCKSSEGYVALHFPNYFDRRRGVKMDPMVTVYSYVLGPSRSHDFNNIDEALAAVREWHEAEMSYDYSDD